ncbi:retrotransposon protein [Striga asiatica]|uniref:Retrotransposon protein n=1 Tax=Striga asiatica TaxID=4170 RepID=A0A5A7R3A0_STRAF|nr:retrotransposon protein [Striga asiatica]
MPFQNLSCVIVMSLLLVLFWKELFRLSGTKLSFSSAYHPQSDGQTEVANSTVEMYLRRFTDDRPKGWVVWVSWAEYCSNTSFHSSLHATPFEVVYGRQPPYLLSYSPTLSQIQAVDYELRARDVILQKLRERLLHAQNVMKTYYDSQHRDVSFDVGDVVLLKLQPYRQVSLPEGSKLHPVFHVSCLKKFHGIETCSYTLPLLHKGVPIPTPQAVLDSRIKDGLKEILINWEGLSPSDASGESAEHMQLRYPQFALEDKHSSKGGSDVMIQDQSAKGPITRSRGPDVNKSILDSELNSEKSSTPRQGEAATKTSETPPEGSKDGPNAQPSHTLGHNT